MFASDSISPAALRPTRAWRLDGWVSALAAAPSGIVAAGTNAGTVWLLDADRASPVARVPVGGEVKAIATRDDGAFLVATDDDRVVSIDDGHVPRLFASIGTSRIARVAGDLLLGGRHGDVARVRADGRVVWRTRVPSVWSLDVARDLVVCASTDGFVSAGRAHDGRVAWTRALGYPVYGAVAGEGPIAATAEGRLVRLSAAGDEIASAPLAAVRILRRAPGGVLAATAACTLEAWSESLERAWIFRSGSWIKDVVIVGGDHYVASADHHVTKLDDRGRERASFRAGYTVLALTCTARHLVAGSADDHAYAFHL